MHRWTVGVICTLIKHGNQCFGIGHRYKILRSQLATERKRLILCLVIRWSSFSQWTDCWLTCRPMESTKSWCTDASSTLDPFLLHVYFLTCTYQHQHIGKLGQLEYLISSSILTHHKKNVLIMLFFINHKIIFPTNKILTVEFSSWLVNRGSEWWWHFPPRSIRSLEKRKISCNDRLIIIIFIKWIQL